MGSSSWKLSLGLDEMENEMPSPHEQYSSYIITERESKFTFKENPLVSKKGNLMCRSMIYD